MKAARIILMISCLAIAACKKKQVQPADFPPSTDPQYPRYSALNVGNYWVYERYVVFLLDDSSSSLGIYDSSYVEKDTVINNKTYFKYVTLPIGIVEFLRDSLHYIVSSSGGILFSSVDFTTVFATNAFGPSLATTDTVTRTQKMTVRDSTIVVPAGSFVASAFSYIYDNANPAKPDIRLNNWYAKDIGAVQRVLTSYSSDYRVFESRLVRYHVQ